MTKEYAHKKAREELRKIANDVAEVERLGSFGQMAESLNPYSVANVALGRVIDHIKNEYGTDIALRLITEQYEIVEAEHAQIY